MKVRQILASWPLGRQRRRPPRGGLRFASLLFVSALFPGVALTNSPGNTCAVHWPLWDQLISYYVSDDGRIIDDSVATLHSTSESQSYGMFFALVANDREHFDAFWQWSIDNLFDGDISARLPAWQWGRNADGDWGVLDANAASDADLWFVYSLYEAARLWQAPAYAEQARVLKERIVADEIVELPGFGTMLLPGPDGFEDAERALWRLNPSYFVIPQFRLLDRHHPEGPWLDLAGATLTMTQAVTPFGVVADWVAYHQTGDAQGEFVIDPMHGDLGSYDAIRAYLWAAITADDDPLALPLRDSLRGMEHMIDTWLAVPERVYAASGRFENHGPPGFQAALLPWLQREGQFDRVRQWRRQLADDFSEAAQHSPDRPPYYDMMLALFGLGWFDGHYRFEADGTLRVRWEDSC